jgi:NAD dependent epimerase/dehydratase family enzyme
MKIIIPGGTGRVGSVLARALHDEGHEVVVLSRRRPALPWRVADWDGVTLGPWSTEVDGSDVVINLAGRDVNCRYTAGNRQAILESRTQSTRIVGEAKSRSRRPPHTWFGLPATEWMAAIGAFFMRTETELVLKSRRVVPGRLLQHGFTFRYPAWPAAAMDLCGRSRGQETRARRRRPAGAASPTTPTRV